MVIFESSRPRQKETRRGFVSWCLCGKCFCASMLFFSPQRHKDTKEVFMPTCFCGLRSSPCTSRLSSGTTSRYCGATIAVFRTSQPSASKNGSIRVWRTWASLTPGVRNALQLVSKYRHSFEISSLPWSNVLITINILSASQCRPSAAAGFIGDPLHALVKGFLVSAFSSSPIP